MRAPMGGLMGKRLRGECPPLRGAAFGKAGQRDFREFKHLSNANNDLRRRQAFGCADDGLDRMQGWARVSRRSLTNP